MYRLFISVLFLLLLVACGGGSDDSDQTDTGVQPPGEGFVLAGTIRPDALNRVDTDTNDPESPTQRNNQLSTAQSVLAPAIIGGFVAAEWSENRFGLAADEWDFYAADLREGQAIILDFPDAPALDNIFPPDLDLYLFAGNGDLVDSSLGWSPIEFLTAPYSGPFFIGVRAYYGASNYTLRLDAQAVSGLDSVATLRLSDDFVPGELIILPESSQEFSTGALSADKAFAAVPGLQRQAGGEGREQLWRLESGFEELALAALNVPQPDFAPLFQWTTEQAQRHATLIAAKRLRQQSSIAAVAPNYRIHTQQVLPNDPLQGLQWHHQAIALPEAWAVTTGHNERREVIIAVVDTGVFLDHTDLQGQLLPGYDFISNPATARDGDGIDPNPDDPGDSDQLGRSSWHGTHVAGIAAARSNNAIGIAGVSWGARIMPIRTLGTGGGTVYDTLQGIRFAAGLPNDSGRLPARPADIINLSLGGGRRSDVEAALFQTIRERGIFVVAASGNENSAVSFPAAYASVLAVGATDANSRRAPYSNFGERLDLVAPGGDMRVDLTGDGYGDGILSLVADDSSGVRRPAYRFMQGTSMATPVVSGVIALARALDPTIDPDWFSLALASGQLTDDLGPTGWDPETGWGQINAQRTLNAVRARLDGEPLPAALSVTPQSLEFGTTISEIALTVRAVGTQALGVEAITTGVDWLQISAVSVDNAGIGTYRASVQRERLTPGDWNATMQIRGTNGQILSVPVRLRVVPATLTQDTVGRIYVLLVDEAGETLEERGVNSDQGVYRYRFEQVPPGEYHIVAGSDMNDDLMICDAGEACGAYPTLALFETITVDRNLLNLDFTIGFRPEPEGAFSAQRESGLAFEPDLGYGSRTWAR